MRTLLRSVLALMALAPAADPAAGQPAAPPTATAPSVAAPIGDLRVVVWNVQRGANAFAEGPEKTLGWLRAAAPDVVLMQESYDIDGERPTLGRWLAAELGWDAWQGESPHLCVLSRLTFEETFFHEGWHAIGARLADDQGRSLVAYSIWIDSRAYTPYALRDEPEAGDQDLLANETERSGRLAQTGAIVRHLRDSGHLGTPSAPAGPLPLLVGGDWNCPSHLDWTRDAALVFRFRRELPLPVSLTMAGAGFEDVFRAVHPSPLSAPGITWSPLYRGDADQPETADRIDRLYALPPRTGAALRPVAAFTLPGVYEDPSVPQAERLFPSDHAAVVFDFAWHEQGPCAASRGNAQP